MRALEALGQQVQLLVAIALSLDFLDRRQHVIAVVARLPVALAHEMQLPLQRQPSGILPVAAVHHVAERVHALLRVVVEPDGARGLAIDQGDLLACPQVGDGGRALFRRNPIGNAAAIAAAVEPEHQAGRLWRAAVHEGIDAERAVGADQAGMAALEDVEARPPHQRSVGENPQVCAGLLNFCGHRVGIRRRGRVDRARRLRSPNRAQVPAQPVGRGGRRNAVFGRSLNPDGPRPEQHLLPRAAPGAAIRFCCSSCWR